MQPCTRSLVILIIADEGDSAAFDREAQAAIVVIAIDIIVSNILLAMGMMMVSPVTISLPFKLLLFVMVNGWTLLIQGLVRGYAI